MAEPDLIPDTEDEDEFIRLHGEWSAQPVGGDLPKTGYWGSHLEKGKFTVKLPRGCDPDKEGGGAAAKRLPGVFNSAQEANEARAKYLFNTQSCPARAACKQGQARRTTVCSCCLQSTAVDRT